MISEQIMAVEIQFTEDDIEIMAVEIHLHRG